MWRKPKLIIETVDALLGIMMSSGNQPVPHPTPAPTPTPPGWEPPKSGCIIERCSYLISCDLFPIF